MDEVCPDSPHHQSHCAAHLRPGAGFNYSLSANAGYLHSEFELLVRAYLFARSR
jgi:hypothetical protein